jgi:hypothetical protein
VDAWCSHTQSPVALAISSPTFLGDRPRGPILGASAEEAPTSPPVARRWLFQTSVSPVLLETVVAALCAEGSGFIDVHHLDLIGIELRSCTLQKSVQCINRQWLIMILRILSVGSGRQG